MTESRRTAEEWQRVGGGIKQKEKRTCGHGQTVMIAGAGGTRGLNGNGRKQ